MKGSGKIQVGRWAAAAAAAMLAMPAAALAQAGGTLEGRVVGVTDGDTITVLTGELRTVTVRLFAVDAPETSCHAKVPTPADAACVEQGQPFGKTAKRFTSGLVFGKKVRVQLTGDTTYDRQVGTIWVDGRDVNLSLVEAGLACHYAKYARRGQDTQTFERYAAAERAARAQKLGQWADPRSMCGWDWRAQQRQG